MAYYLKFCNYNFVNFVDKCENFYTLLSSNISNSANDSKFLTGKVHFPGGYQAQKKLLDNNSRVFGLYYVELALSPTRSV